MDISLIEIIKKAGKSRIDSCYGQIETSFSAYESVLIEKGFFFLLVTNGTVLVTNDHHQHLLSANHLLVITPSLRSSLTSISKDFSCSCLYIVPEYFDTLPASQLVYNQVSPHVGNYHLAIFLLEPQQSDYLHKTLALFSKYLEKMPLYRDGALRHLGSFLLLQIADMLHKKNKGASGYMKRSSEVFRQFKKLLIENYCRQHNISFYADHLNISTTYLSRIIKQVTGHTVRFHLDELLCADARRMLECTDMDIKKIADSLGFSDQSVFGKFFMRKTGFSPLNFRMRKETAHKKS